MLTEDFWLDSTAETFSTDTLFSSEDVCPTTLWKQKYVYLYLCYGYQVKKDQLDHKILLVNMGNRLYVEYAAGKN